MKIKISKKAPQEMWMGYAGRRKFAAGGENGGGGTELAPYTVGNSNKSLRIYTSILELHTYVL